MKTSIPGFISNLLRAISCGPRASLRNTEYGIRTPSARTGEHRLTSDGCVRCLVLLFIALTAFTVSASAPNLVIHEWGTFTSLQDEHGQAIGGINTDDEPVPPFVHHAGIYVFPDTDIPASGPKGFPRCDIDVTMRLETPVLYFHPTPGSAALPLVTVSATFPGGVLSEFYPQAISTIVGVPSNSIPPLRPTTIGILTWPNLAIHTGSAQSGNWSGPATTDRVWTSPRAVDAADIRATNGEAERFLFYRGVAHLDAPITVTRDGDRLNLRSDNFIGNELYLTHRLWLVDITPGGTTAFRTLSDLALLQNGMIMATTPATFAAADYFAANHDTLRATLHDALVHDGLFADEADALLNTWQASYFKSPGLRLFFLVPHTWTDIHLPLHVSVPADITRVMVGRIELVTPAQRQILATIAQAPVKTIQSNANQLTSDLVAKFTANATNTATRLPLDHLNSLKGLGITAPPLYQSYLDLGRFRNALILEAARENPTPSLNAFIATYGLRGYAPAGTDAATTTAAAF